MQEREIADLFAASSMLQRNEVDLKSEILEGMVNYTPAGKSGRKHLSIPCASTCEQPKNRVD